VALFYGLLYSSKPLPWDQPLDQGSVQLRPSSDGVEIILGEERLGHMTESYAEGVEAGDTLIIPPGIELKLFANPRAAVAWQSWAERQQERWNQGLNELLRS
jgi:hypothetical protein